MRVDTTDDPSRFLEATHAHLAARPALHNLILTLAHARVERPVAGRYAWATEARRIAGVALQSPVTFAAALGPGTRGAVRALARALAADVPELPGVTGGAPSASVFAGEWATVTRARVTPRAAQRLYELTRLRPVRGVPGALREVRAAEVDTIASWVERFQTEIGEPSPGGSILDEVEALVRARLIWCWDDDGPRTITSATPTIAGVARVRHVYTPREQRGRGYAAACVAGVSERLLGGRARACVLFTQLTNPTSNAVYQRLGYRPISEILAYRFDR